MKRLSSRMVVCAFLLLGLVIGTAPARAASMFTPALRSPFTAGGSPAAVAFSPNSKLLATANPGASGTASVFSVGAGGALTPVSGSPFAAGPEPNAVAFSPAGNLLAIANDFGSTTVSIFSVGAGGALAPVSGSPFATSVAPYKLAFSPDGKLLAVAGGKVAVFSLGTGGALTEVAGSPVAVNGGNALSVAFSPDSKLLAATSLDGGTVSVFSVGASGVLTQVSGSPFAAGAQPRSVAFSADGGLLATANSADNTVSMFSVGAGGALTPASGSPFSTDKWPASVAFSSSGLLAVANGVDKTVSVFSVNAGGSLAPVSGSPYKTGADTLSEVAFSPDGSMFATANPGLGGLSDGTVSVFFHDATAPTIPGPGNVTAEATAASGAVVSYDVHATDPDSPVAVVCDHPSGSTFAMGSTVVHCTAGDPSGNSTSVSFTVTVRDTTPPSTTVPATIRAEATSGLGAIVNYSVSAGDLVDGPVSVACTPRSGSTFPIAVTSVSCVATDSAGNAGDGSFIVVVAHTAGPVITLPPTVTAEAIGPTGARVTYAASAYDAVDGPATPSCTPVSGSMFRLGTTRVSCGATDKSGHMGYGGVDVVIVDTTRPAMTVPRTITAEATGPTGAKVVYTTSASDIVDGPVSASCTPASGSTFKLGATNVSCTATDKSGNAGRGAFRVVVRDTTKPALKLPGAMIVGARGPQDAIVFYSTIARDLVDGLIAPVCTPSSGSHFMLVATLVRCTATDKSHNVSRGSFTITIKATAPWLTNVNQTHQRWVSGSGLPRYAKGGPPIGTTFTYSLNQPAQVTFAFAGRTTGRQRTVTATLRHQSHAGKNALHFEGRITRARWLPPGTYTVKITAAANGHRSYVRILQFTIIG